MDHMVLEHSWEHKHLNLQILDGSLSGKGSSGPDGPTGSLVHEELLVGSRTRCLLLFSLLTSSPCFSEGKQWSSSLEGGEQLFQSLSIFSFSDLDRNRETTWSSS